MTCRTYRTFHYPTSFNTHTIALVYAWTFCRIKVSDHYKTAYRLYPAFLPCLTSYR